MTKGTCGDCSYRLNARVFQPPPARRDLCPASYEQRKDNDECGPRCGERKALDWIKQLEDDATKSQDRIKELEEIIGKREEKIDELGEEVEQLKEEIHDMEGETQACVLTGIEEAIRRANQKGDKS